jgi:NitT/TauT family transport system substrate-binding protein
MSNQHARQVSRRMFLGGLTLLGTTGFLGLYPRSIAAESPPETTKIRLGHSTAICVAPLYVAAELLPAEGFTEVQYIRTGQEGVTQGSLRYDAREAP